MYNTHVGDTCRFMGAACGEKLEKPSKQGNYFISNINTRWRYTQDGPLYNHFGLYAGPLQYK